MSKHRKHYTPEEKVSILRQHLADKVPISDLCQEHKLQPTVFYRWLKEFFENGAAAFRGKVDREAKNDKHRIAALERELKTRAKRDIEDKWMVKLTQGSIAEEEVLKRTNQLMKPEDVRTMMSSIPTQPLKYRNRSIAVISHYAGIPLGHIASLLCLSHSSVDIWVEKFVREGAQNLISPYKSNYRKLKDEQYKNAVFEILHAPPPTCGINRTTWRLEDIKAQMARRGLLIGETAISTIIKEAGYRYRKAKRVLTSPDPEYKDKIREKTKILSSLGPKEKFFSIDEFGPFAVKIQGGKSLALRGHAKTIPQHQVSKGSIIVTGALELSMNQITYFYSQAKNSTEMIKLLDLLVEKYAKEDRIYLSWDAASWHASKGLYERVDEINSTSGKKYPEVKLTPLPCSAQFLNVIESVFSGMARAILDNSDYESVDACRKAIDLHFGQRNVHFRENPKRAGNKIWGKEKSKPQFNEANNCKDPRYR